ncbi:MAG: coenzyme F420-0:L-glutamate ligase [Candidatus Falkowbacteria bacterium]|nr:coenzyme F420-0:L-glutamate ligase [Candidatus Falkowbacteria bacterium]
MKTIKLMPLVGLPLVERGSKIANLIMGYCERNNVFLQDNDIFVIAQKIISKAEGAVVDLKTITPTVKASRIAKKTGRDPRLVQVYLNEASELLYIKGRMVITRHRLGFIMSSSGVDRSNIAPHSREVVVLLPKNPDLSARRIKNSLKRLSGKNVAVIINDSCGRKDRDGSVGMAIGIAGISALEIRSQSDLYSNLSQSRIALIDEMAAAGSILMGQANEGVPVVLIRGAVYSKSNKSKITNILF